ncbi:pilin [Pseudomonas sp. NW5]|uniref:pilin n=1 Tax=Pseudomonas sp. NW5 TaxID=2934934 RepID=UPI0020208EE6|nr:pilin [Pseudomonas sp. NW5]MCL7461241.1 pilin [Pseudomonas sp. NW5]
MHAQRGFTLIELMIVVAIISALVLVGMPAYQDYLKRTKVSEGLVLASSAKALVIENAANGVRYGAGWSSPSATDNVKSVAIDDETGQITVTFQSAIQADGTLVLRPYTGGRATPTALPDSTGSYSVPGEMIAWACGAKDAAAPAVAGTLAAGLAPANCR